MAPLNHDLAAVQSLLSSEITIKALCVNTSAGRGKVVGRQGIILLVIKDSIPILDVLNQITAEH